jgi:hypothetical protein
MAIGSFTAKDKRDYGSNGMIFSPPDGSRNLRISFPEGSVEYWSTRNYGTTNLAANVPRKEQLRTLTEALLPKLGINLSEISTDTDTGKPKLSLFESPMQYFAGPTIITNLEWSGVRFNRALEGVELGGNGGNCEIDFGDHGRVITISLSWWGLQRDKMCLTASPATITRWLREGRAVYQPVRGKFGNEVAIDWPHVKTLEVIKAQPYYWGEVHPTGHNPGLPHRLRPFAALLATVETDGAKTELTVQCPIIDDTRTPGAPK